MTLKQIVVSAVVVLGIFTGGYYVGKTDKDSAAKDVEDIAKYKNAIDELFPEPPVEVFDVRGTIKIVARNFVTIEILSFQQRVLPWEEPQPRTKEERKVIVVKDTELVKIDPLAPIEFTESGELTEQGEPLTLSELKKGDSIRVKSNQNIKTNKEFTASQIEFVVIDVPEILQ